MQDLSFSDVHKDEYPSEIAMMAAVEMEIHSALGRVQTVTIGKIIQRAIVANEKTEIERLRYIIGALVEWRDKPWVQKEIIYGALAKVDDTALTFDEKVEKARSETISVWDAARGATKPSDRGETG